MLPCLIILKRVEVLEFHTDVWDPHLVLNVNTESFWWHIVFTIDWEVEIDFFFFFKRKKQILKFFKKDKKSWFYLATDTSLATEHRRFLESTVFLFAYKANK